MAGATLIIVEIEGVGSGVRSSKVSGYDTEGVRWRTKVGGEGETGAGWCNIFFVGLTLAGTNL